MPLRWINEQVVLSFRASKASVGISILMSLLCIMLSLRIIACNTVAIPILLNSLLCAKGGGLPLGKTEGLSPILSFGTTTKSTYLKIFSHAIGASKTRRAEFLRQERTWAYVTEQKSPLDKVLRSRYAVKINKTLTKLLHTPNQTTIIQQQPLRIM